MPTVCELKCGDSAEDTLPGYSLGCLWRCWRCPSPPPPPIHAQEPDFVDLSVSINEFEDPAPATPSFLVRVANLGGLTAYDVEVEIKGVGKGLGIATVISFPSVTAISSGEYTPYSSSTTHGIWRIPSVEGYADQTLILSYAVSQRPQVGIPVQFDAVLRSPFETEERMYNNRHTLLLISTSNGLKVVRAVYEARVTVNDPHPEIGETVNYTIEAYLQNTPTENDITEGCINIGLSPGLTAGVPSFTPALSPYFDWEASYVSGGSCLDRNVKVRDIRGIFGESDFDVSGAFHIGSTFPTGGDSYTMTLPVTVGSEAEGAEQCLTAEIFALPPAGTGEYENDPRFNLDKLCLNEDTDALGFYGDVLPLSEGEIDLFTWYDCAEEQEATGACGDDVSLELLAQGGDAAAAAGSSRSIFQPEEVVVHIQDPLARQTSSAADSDAIVWATGFDFSGSDDYPGVILAASTETLDVVSTDGTLWGRPHPSFNTWEQGEASLALSGPGAMSLWYVSSGATASWSFWGGGGILAEGGSFSNPDHWIGSTADAGYRHEIWLEFSTLGTYELDMDIGTLYDADTTDAIAGVEYTDSQTYTFHVGPMADLGVGDGGASVHARPDQRAITIAAINNGPDHAMDAEVDIDLRLPPGVMVVDHVASDGVYNGTRVGGKWDIGELKFADWRRAAAMPPEATLTLILEGANAHLATATASIDAVYSVCVASDGSTAEATTEAACDAISGAVWHSGNIYNLEDDNNAATAAAHPGKGSPLRMSPVTAYQRATLLEWDYPTNYLYGAPIIGFDVEWSDNPLGIGGWTRMESALPRASLVDLTVRPGETRYYRVRPVSEAGYKGAWSAPMSPATGPLVFDVAALAIAEGGSRSYNVALETKPSETVRVRIEESFTSFANLEYHPEILFFTPENYNVPQTVTVSAPRDYPSNVSATLHHIPSGSGYRVIADLPVTVLDVDAGVAGVIVSETALSIAGNGGTASYTVALRSRPSDDVHIVARPDDKYLTMPEPMQLMFTPSNWDTPRTVTVTAMGDGSDDTSLRFTTLNHFAFSDDPDYDDIAVPSVELTVTGAAGSGGDEDDAETAVVEPGDGGAGVSISETSLSVSESGGIATYVVSLDRAPDADVYVWVETGDGGAAVVSPDWLLFTPSNWATPQTVAVIGIDDDDLNTGGARTATARHLATSNDPAFDGVGIASVSVTVTDDDGVSVPVVPDPREPGK